MPFVALEIGFDQADAVEALLGGPGALGVERLRDLAGHERVIVGPDADDRARCRTRRTRLLGAEVRALLAVAVAVAVFPADTVYGLACDPANRFAVERLYLLKRRALSKPSAVMFFDLELALSRRCPELGERTRGALARLLPGGVTLLLPNPAGAVSARVRRGSRRRSGCASRVVADARRCALAGAPVEREPGRRAGPAAARRRAAS